MIAHSLQAWATALGMERRTLESRLVKSGVEVKKRGKKNGDPIPARKVFEALNSSAAEKDRLTSAMAKKIERENAEAEGILHTRAGVEKVIWEEGLKPLREQIVNFPKSTGIKLKTFLQSSGMTQENISKAVEIANAGVKDLLDNVEIHKPKS